MSRIWSNWLVVWCWAMVAFGAVLVTAAIPALDGGVRSLLVAFSSGSTRADSLDAPAMRFAVGLMGALTLGWGLTILAAVRSAEPLGPRFWRALTLAMLVWFVLDSTISISTGFWINAVSNTVFLIGFLAPVIASRILKDA